MDEDLKALQQNSTAVEEKMLEFLVGFIAAENMRLCDVKYIATMARRISFDAFSPKTGP